MRRFSALLVIVPALVACAGSPASRDHQLPVTRIELSATPFHAQDAHQCGPAALATVLGAGGVAVSPDELVSKVYLPARKGSIQAEMVAATRTFDRVPYLLRPDLDALLQELAAGAPVLVLQNLGLRKIPVWHYAVVIGYDPGADALLLRSGKEKRLVMARSRFLSSWDRAGNWALVTPSPGQIPVTANSHDWLRAASAFESLRKPAVAVAAYTAATRRWPDQPLAWQALANARYAQGDISGAEVALRQALQLSPSAAAWNNLAQVLLERGCRAAALTGIARAEAAADAGTITVVLANTRADIERHATGDAPDCP